MILIVIFFFFIIHPFFLFTQSTHRLNAANEPLLTATPNFIHHVPRSGSLCCSL